MDLNAVRTISGEILPHPLPFPAEFAAVVETAEVAVHFPVVEVADPVLVAAVAALTVLMEEFLPLYPQSQVVIPA